MLIKTCLLSGLLLCGLFSISYSQHAPAGAGGQLGMSIGDHLLIQEVEDNLNGKPDPDVVGSPYLSDQFVKGTVHSNKGTFSDVEMRYNIYKDYVEFKQDGQIYALDPSPEIRRVDMGGYSLVSGQVQSKKKEIGFYVLLDSGKVTLIAKKDVSFREARAPQALQASATPAKFTTMPDTHYYKIGNGPLIKVGSLKKMITSLPDNHEELQAFASREKISTSKEDELLRLVRYYNSLGR